MKRILAAVTLSAAVAAPASASVARAVTFDQKVQEADGIVLGTCTKSYSSFDSTGRWIVTYSTFDVEEDLKDASRKQVVLVTPGGSVGALHQETIGIPKFAPGDEKLLFVKKIAGGETVLYADQGTYDVIRDGAQLKIAPVASKLVLVDARSGSVRNEREPARSLDTFRRTVRETLNREQPSEGGFNEAGTIKRRESTELSASQDNRLANFLGENKVAVIMLLLGIALSAIPLIRRR